MNSLVGSGCEPRAAAETFLPLRRLAASLGKVSHNQRVKFSNQALNVASSPVVREATNKTPFR